MLMTSGRCKSTAAGGRGRVRIGERQKERLEGSSGSLNGPFCVALGGRRRAARGPQPAAGPAKGL